MAGSSDNADTVPHIRFLYFDGCPLAEKAREALENALQLCGLDVDRYERIDVLASSTPAKLAGWGSPTILVDGLDVAGNAKGDGVGCRIYDTPERVPSAETIASVIRQAKKR